MIEAPKDPNRLSLKRSIPTHIIIKLSNVHTYQYVHTYIQLHITIALHYL